MAVIHREFRGRAARAEHHRIVVERGTGQRSRHPANHAAHCPCSSRPNRGTPPAASATPPLRSTRQRPRAPPRRKRDSPRRRACPGRCRGERHIERIGQKCPRWRSADQSGAPEQVPDRPGKEAGDEDGIRRRITSCDFLAQELKMQGQSCSRARPHGHDNCKCQREPRSGRPCPGVS